MECLQFRSGVADPKAGCWSLARRISRLKVGVVKVSSCAPLLPEEVSPFSRNSSRLSVVCVKFHKQYRVAHGF